MSLPDFMRGAERLNPHERDDDEWGGYWLEDADDEPEEANELDDLISIEVLDFPWFKATPEPQGDTPQ